MIVNTELEQKGNLFPSEIVNYKKDVDTLYFTTKNNVVLQLTVLEIVLLDLDTLLLVSLKMISLTELRNTQAEDIIFWMLQKTRYII